MEEYNIEVKANTSSFAGLVSDNFKKVNLFKYIKKVFDYLRTTPGTVLNDTMVGVDDLTIISVNIATTKDFVIFLTYDYTPVSKNSYLIIEYFMSRYKCDGTMSDSWMSQLLVDGTEISYGYQATSETDSFRTGTLFPIAGRFINSLTTIKQIQIAAKQDDSDDSILIDNGANSMYLRITEVAR